MLSGHSQLIVDGGTNLQPREIQNIFCSQLTASEEKNDTPFAILAVAEKLPLQKTLIGVR